MNAITNTAIQLIENGMSVIPVTEKKPTIHWKEYQSRIPTIPEINNAFSSTKAEGVAVICGAVSGGLEIMDFDCHGEAFESWFSNIPENLKRILVIEKTPSGGYHVIYRCYTIEGNQKLAIRNDNKVLIETRGEGGYFVTVPSPGYTLIQGDFFNIPLISENGRNLLHDTARKFNQITKKSQSDIVQYQLKSVIHSDGLTPIDDFNKNFDLQGYLVNLGWSVQFTNSEGVTHLTRPGKESGTSGTIRHYNGIDMFTNFSSSVPDIPTGEQMTAFQTYMYMSHRGNQKESIENIVKAGYGDKRPTMDFSKVLCRREPVVLTKTETKIEIGQNSNAENYKEPLPGGQQILYKVGFFKDDFCDEKEPEDEDFVIYGLFRFRETFNIIASPKTGKSWLMLDMGLSLSAGSAYWLRGPNGDDLRFKIPKPLKVLYVDNEMRQKSFRKRLKILAKRKGISDGTNKSMVEKLGDRFQYICLRDRPDIPSPDLSTVKVIIDSYVAAGFVPDVIILDALYRFLGTFDENSNNDMREVYNYINNVIIADNHYAIGLVHHTSKGDQSLKSVTDLGSGAGAISRATDTHITITPHEQPGFFNFEYVTRSIKSGDPFVFSVDDDGYHVHNDMDVVRFSPAKKTTKKSDNNDNITQKEPSKKDKISELYHQGYTQEQLVKEFGFTKQTVSRVLKQVKSGEDTYTSYSDFDDYK